MMPLLYSKIAPVRSQVRSRDIVDIPSLLIQLIAILFSIYIDFDSTRCVSAICLSKVCHSFQFLLQKV